MKPFIAAILALAALHLSACTTSYVERGSINPTSISAPLKPESAAWKREADLIVALQTNINKERIAKAVAERDMAPELMTDSVLPDLDRNAYPSTHHLLDRTGATSKAITSHVKDYWNTKRPYESDPRIKSLIEPHTNPAYPSGHTSGSYVWAEVLTMLFPEHKKALRARAEEIAQHRVLVGMHFPHDVKGGKELAKLIVAELMKNGEFQVDLSKARKELRDHPLP